MAGLDIEVNDGDTGRQQLVSLIDKVSKQQDSDPKVRSMQVSGRLSGPFAFGKCCNQEGKSLIGTEGLCILTIWPIL